MTLRVPPMSYASFDPMINTARHRPALWRLILGVITIVVVLFVWFGALVLITRRLLDTPDTDAVLRLAVLETHRPESVILNLFLIAGLALGTFVAAALWHKRRPASLFGAGAKTLRHFAIAAGLTFAAMAFLQVIGMPFLDSPSLNLDPIAWISWLPLALLGILVQTGAEEILFRGYLQSQLAARFKSPVWWLLLPSILFALLHLTPEYSTALATYILLATFAFGVMAADLTARTGSIGAAWGFHFANNTLAILLISSQSTLSGLALFKSSIALDQITHLSPLFVLDIVIVVLVWLLIRRVLAR
ncbi:CPBP family intramembrane metalloprotease [Rhodobacteraceae bacterium]|nr:CPBP family intramembrane metalloprotease [Paracoccaceae bacterium]